MASDPLGNVILLPLDIKLNGQNYREWASSARMQLRSYGVASDLNDDPPHDKEDEKKIAAWRRNDERVMAFLCMSAEVPIRMNFIDLSSAKKMWEYLQQRYQQSSAALRFSLRKSLQSLEQGDMTIEEFHNAFTSLSRQLDSMVPKAGGGCRQCICKEKYEEQSLMFDFVMRLRLDFEPIRVQLLGRSTLPTMAEALADLIAEETRLQSLPNATTPQHTVLASSLMGTSLSGDHAFQHGSLATSSTQIVCSHCKRSGHRVEKCFKLHPELLAEFRAKRGASRRAPSTSVTLAAPTVTAASISATSTSQPYMSAYQPGVSASLSPAPGTSQSWVLDSGSSFI